MPKPRFTGEEIVLPFTNRDDQFKHLANVLRDQPPDEHHVLFYYGMGGIGKSRLSEELMRMLEGESDKATEMGLLTDSDERATLCFARIDFQEKQLRSEIPHALFTMRSRLAERHGLRFPAFDVAYGEWWGKRNPNVEMQTSELPFLKEGDFLIEFLSVTTDLPGAGLVSKIPELGQKFLQKYRAYRLKQRLESLNGLQALRSHEIEKRLPYFWALDLKHEIERKDRRVVLFLDSYEKLYKGNRPVRKQLGIDELVREWVTHLPGVLWVFTGRDQLYWHREDAEWADIIDHQRVGDFSETDARQLLSESGITDAAIQDAMVETAKGVPYYLELALNIYREKKRQGKTPQADDFTGTPYELHQRFFSYLDNNALVRALELLAVPRTWDMELYAVLEEHFDPGYPVDYFDNLTRFPFVTRLEDGTYTLHELTRDALHKHGRKNLKEVHRFLFEHYTAILGTLDQPRDVGSDHERALSEAFYHGQAIMELEAFAEWMHSAGNIFNAAGRWRLLEGLYTNLLSLQEGSLGAKHIALGPTMNNIARLYSAQGRYENAEVLYEQLLVIVEKTLSKDHPNVATTLNNLAAVYCAQGRYDDAQPLYQRALRIRQKALGKNHPHIATTLNNLAGLYKMQGRYDDAQPLYQRALKIREQALRKDHPHVATTLNNLAGLLKAQGRYDEAETLYQRALKIREQALGKNHPHIATTMDNLAGLYKVQGRYDDAGPIFREALIIAEEALDMDHPYVGATLSNLADLYSAQGRYDDAEPLFQQALQIREQALGQIHPHIGATLNNLAGLYKVQSRYDDAEPLFQRALEILKNRLGSSHPDTQTVRANYEEMKNDRDEQG